LVAFSFTLLCRSFLLQRERRPNPSCYAAIGDFVLLYVRNSIMIGHVLLFHHFSPRSIYAYSTTTTCLLVYVGERRRDTRHRPFIRPLDETCKADIIHSDDRWTNRLDQV
jgi:hypothetical protein